MSPLLPIVARLPSISSDGFAVHAQPISGRDRQVEEFSLLGPIDDRLVVRLVRADLAAGFQALADRPADVGRLCVGERGDRDPVARVLGFERVPALDVEVGDLPHYLVGVTLEEFRRSVLALHCEGCFRFAVAEEGGDLAVAVVFLADSGQNLGHGGLRQNAFQERDRVARLDRLHLFPVAEHLDGHAGFGLQLEELQHRAGTDLADLVDDKDGFVVGREFAGVDRVEERLEGPGFVDAGVFEGVGLPPGRRHADDRSAVVAPGVDQRLQKRRLARAGDAGQE